MDVSRELMHYSPAVTLGGLVDRLAIHLQDEFD